MVIPAALVILPLGVLFFVSGLVVNLIQAICFILIRPITKNGYRRINRLVAELLWLELVWIVDWWAGVKIKVYTDCETLKLMGKEHALVVSNHRSDIDWLVGWILAQVPISFSFLIKDNSTSICITHIYGCIFLHLLVSKYIACYVFLSEHKISVFNAILLFVLYFLLINNFEFHVVEIWMSWQHVSCNEEVIKIAASWSMWFSEYLFLERSWAKDEITLKSGLLRLKDFPLPFWLALFVEGTRFTEAKLLAAKEYANANGLPVPRNVLIPRTKGFVSAVGHMRSFAPAIYDVTVAIPKSSPPPTMLRLFKGQPSVVHVHIKRHSMKELPETDDAIAQWCRDMFVAKDALMDKHVAEDTFSDQELQDLGRPIKSLLVVISWTCLLILGSLKLLQGSSFLSSWKGLTFSASCLAIVTVLMQILIRFSQSERSTPAKVVSAKPKSSGEPLTPEGSLNRTRL
ncbi:1-acyl-sn-glycerol-3-phosphate acyltransferase PLS1, partial [Cucurbita argyrosperma subsp. argyrosperma]